MIKKEEEGRESVHEKEKEKERWDGTKEEEIEAIVKKEVGEEKPG